MSSSRYAVVLAGGSGKRFWPLSRNHRPKQLLRLFGEETLLEQAIHRLKGLIPPENILVLTNSSQEEGVRAAIGSLLPTENIVSEPERRDTAPAIAFAIGWVAAHNPNASMAVLPSDHLIKDVHTFQNTINNAFLAAEQNNALLTIGIRPTWACPSYGYIERGSRISTPTNPASAFKVIRFREKPDTELAEKFIAQGNFCWNTGMFIWTIPTALRELTLHTPKLATFVHNIIKSSDCVATLNAQYSQLPSISIDYALMEKSSNVLNIDATFDWDDVGNWLAIGKYLAADALGNQHNSPTIAVQAHNNITFSEQNLQIALLGVSNLVIVQTKDALLITTKDQAEQIKSLVDKVPDELL